ncbi:MAG: hypothetical protein WDM70_07825 [Nitrosomonadales bacterium]
MTLQEKLISKLQPHADRIQNGNNDEFDYLPAVLLHLIEDQKLQSKTTVEFINQARGDVKNGVGEISRLVSQTQADLQERIANLSKLAADDIQSVLKLSNQAKDDAKNGMDEISVHLSELKTFIAIENQKTRRLLLAGLLFGVVTLVIAILLYVRH